MSLWNRICDIFRTIYKRKTVMTKAQVPDRYWRPMAQDWNKWSREQGK